MVGKKIRPWTDEEIEKLKGLIAAKASAARASVILKRTQNSVKNKAREVGLKFPAVQRLSFSKIHGPS